METSKKIIQLTRNFAKEINCFKFVDPVKYVYNPLDYAIEVHLDYLKKFCKQPKKIIFLGMNPGPFGMAQTGIPFGEIDFVKNWMGLSGKINKPKKEHKKRLVHGFECQRSEVSGKRLWSFLKDEFITPEAFFKDQFIINYCPLLFLNEKGTNITPDKIKREYTDKLFILCDEFLLSLVSILKSKKLVGIGKFAGTRLEKLFSNQKDISIYSILHPSPASPMANRGWAKAAKKQLIENKIWPI